MIQTAEVSITYKGDGVQTSFPYPYPYRNSADIIGYIINDIGYETRITTNFKYDEVSNTYQYPLSGEPLSSSYSIKLIRETPQQQNAALPSKLPFSLIEKSLDWIIMILQEIGSRSNNLWNTRNDCKLSETNARNSASAAANSEDKARLSENNAKSSANAAANSENMGKKWAIDTTSPDGATDNDSYTGKTQSSRTWALYSKEQAQAAKVSETNAKDSETNAKDSETNAKDSETNAKASATKAALSEDNAKTSETKAATSATEAALSEDNARTSEQNAKASETKVATSAQNAKTSETNAKDSETNASSSAESASSSETNALASELNAKRSEQNAKTSETNAKTSEQNAKTSETNASDSEMSARASEINARTSETNAANSAKQAAESAGVFQDFTGATATTDGTGGKVPKPLAGEQNKYLKADGTWGVIDIPSGNFVTTDTPQTITGLKTIDNKPLVFTGRNSFIPQQYQCAMYKGTADDGVLGVGPLNLTLQTWYGVSIVDSCVHKAPTIAFDARTGRITTILGEAVLCSSQMQILNIYLGNLSFNNDTKRTVTFEHPFDTIPDITWQYGDIDTAYDYDMSVTSYANTRKTSVTVKFTNNRNQRIENAWGYLIVSGRRL